jgi:ferredoxin
MAEMPIIDANKCDGCGLCIDVCSHKALGMVDNVVVIIRTGECDWCTDCEAVCATGAISCPFEIIIQETH